MPQYHYAQLLDGVVVTVSSHPEELNAPNLVPLPAPDPGLLGKRYVDGQFLEPEPPPPAPRELTRAQFLDLFTDVELAALVTAPSNPALPEAVRVQLQVLSEYLKLSGAVITDNPRLVRALDLMVSVGILTEARRAAIDAALHGPVSG